MRWACLTCGTNDRCVCLLAGPVPAHLVQLPRSERSDKHPTYSPLRRRCGLSITCRCAQCSGGTRLHTTRSAMSFRTWWCKTASLMPQLWRHGLRQQTEAPPMLTWSTLMHPPGRGSTWKSLGRGARAGLYGVNAQLRAREEEKRNHYVVRRMLEEVGNMSACGAMGPSTVTFLKDASLRPSEER